MKLLSLVRAQFSRGFLREGLLGLQVAVMLCLMAPVLSDVAEMLSIDKLASQLTSPALFFQASSRYLVPDEMDEADYRQMLDRVDALENVEAVGRMAVGVTSLNTSSDQAERKINITVRFYNEALYTRVNLPLRQRAEAVTEAGQVPVVVTAALAEKYPVGTVMPVADVYFPISRTHQDVTFAVAGILETDGYYYAFMGGGSEITLNALGAKNGSQEYQMMALGGFSQVPALDVAASCLLFVSRASEAICSAVNEAAAGDGVAVTISEMRQNSLRSVVSQQPMVFLAALLMVLLCVTGIITYVWLTVQDFTGRFSLYFICGMTRGRGMAVLVLVHLLPMLLGVGAALMAMRVLALGVTRAGMMLSLAVVIPLTLFCLVVMALRFRTANPILQLRQGE